MVGMRGKKRPHYFAAIGPVFGLFAVSMPGWFGYIRYWTPLILKDDHGDLARQALRWLLRCGEISELSPLAVHRLEIEKACGWLDMVERDEEGRAPGKLEWGYSHFFDPVARQGIDDERFVNALQEYEEYWARALEHARMRNHVAAAKFLGYCCHLLQDMAVPAHTHCVMHGLSNRTADNLELVAHAKRFYLRYPEDSIGEDEAHVELFIGMGLESRGVDASDPGSENEIAGILREYYTEPELTDNGWQGTYRGKFYHPYHRIFPSSPKIKLGDMVTLRNYLMTQAAGRTALLVRHFGIITGTGVATDSTPEAADGAEESL